MPEEIERSARSVIAAVRAGDGPDALARLDPRLRPEVLRVVAEYDPDLLLELTLQAVETVVPRTGRDATVYPFPQRGGAA